MILSWPKDMLPRLRDIVSILSRPLGDVAVDEGQKLRITTPVKGNPVPTFTWTKDGKPIDPKRVHFFSDGELVSAKRLSFTV